MGCGREDGGRRARCQFLALRRLVPAVLVLVVVVSVVVSVVEVKVKVEVVIVIVVVVVVAEAKICTSPRSRHVAAERTGQWRARAVDPRRHASATAAMAAGGVRVETGAHDLALRAGERERLLKRRILRRRWDREPRVRRGVWNYFVRQQRLGLAARRLSLVLEPDLRDAFIHVC